MHSLLLVLIICKLELSTLVGFGFFGGVFQFLFVCLFLQLHLIPVDDLIKERYNIVGVCGPVFLRLFQTIRKTFDLYSDNANQCRCLSSKGTYPRTKWEISLLNKGVEKSEMRAYYAFPYWNMELEIDVKD